MIYVTNCTNVHMRLPAIRNCQVSYVKSVIRVSRLRGLGFKTQREEVCSMQWGCIASRTFDQPFKNSVDQPRTAAVESRPPPPCEVVPFVARRDAGFARSDQLTQTLATRLLHSLYCNRNFDGRRTYVRVKVARWRRSSTNAAAGAPSWWRQPDLEALAAGAEEQAMGRERLSRHLRRRAATAMASCTANCWGDDYCGEADRSIVHTEIKFATLTFVSCLVVT